MMTPPDERARERTETASERALVMSLDDPALGAGAGAKAGRLGELARAGFPVPAGFVVTTDAFSSFMTAAGLGIEAHPDDVMAAPMPPVVERTLRAAAQTLDGSPVAVRSSAVAEDLAGASFAGQYETTLDVRGVDAIIAAVRTSWASAFAPRVVAYRRSLEGAVPLEIAVLVQRMVSADAAGVAFTADPVTGDRGVTRVSAVRGVGEALVSGESNADEWEVRGAVAERRRAATHVLSTGQAAAVAALARRVEDYYGHPQDIEWAITGTTLHLLQARPMTALPDTVTWDAPPGCWARDFRLGEWLGAPVTPLFETWLLERVEGSMHRTISSWFNDFAFPQPAHVVVNGWYFYGLASMAPPPAQALKMLFTAILPGLISNFRRAAGVIPPIAHLGIDWWVEHVRTETSPRYRAIVDEARVSVANATPAELVAVIDRLGDAAGHYFSSMLAVAGYAAKAERPLAMFWHQHVRPTMGGSHMEVVRGLTTQPAEPPAHAVEGLDWINPTLGERAQVQASWSIDHGAVRARVEGDRDQLLERARGVLAAQPRLARRFEALLAEAQRAHVWREQQSAEFTLAWPVLRQAALKLGARLVERGVIVRANDVFFLRRDEVEAAIGAVAPQPLAARALERRRLWDRQSRLAPPLVLGSRPAPLAQAFASAIDLARATRPDERPGLGGVPASPGRVTGPVRVIRGLAELDRLRPGEILVAPLTTPGWTPAFARAAGVVTDTGSLASHSSVVAREYGIPAVVGTGDATTRLRDGQVVTVDGGAGFVEFTDRDGAP